MINVNQITAQLARMPDQALQRYAQMNKSDPYILSLALSESNRRREMRAGAQMSAPEQPKVVDQAIAGMGGLPTLPADNLRGMEQTMAAGGIVAFDEGGEVPRYQSQGLVRYPGMAQYQGLGGTVLPTTSGYEGLSMLDFLSQAGRDLRKKFIRSEEENAARMYGGRTADVFEAKRQRNPMEVGYDPTEYPMPTSTAVAEPSTVGKAAQPAAKVPPTTTTSAPTAQRPAASGPATGGIYALATTPEQMKKEMLAMGITSGVPTEITSGIADVQAAQQALADKDLAQIKAEQAARGQAFAGFEERLKAREGRVSKMEAEQGPMALLQAGFAIMGGASPFGLANIGAGAQVGLKSYSEGLDKLERARDKLDESFAKIEEVRRNESRMDAKELREAENNALKPAIEAKKLGLSALEKNWGFDRQDANKGLELLFRNRQTIIEQEGAMQRTQAQINAVPADVRTYEALGAAAPGSAIRTGFDLAKTAAMRERAVETWSKLAYPAGGLPNEAFLRRYPDPQAYAEEALRQNMGTGLTPGGGSPTIRPR